MVRLAQKVDNRRSSPYAQIVERPHLAILILLLPIRYWSMVSVSLKSRNAGYSPVTKLRQVSPGFSPSTLSSVSE